MDLVTLRAAVDGAFAATAAGLSPWPNPHPDFADVRDEEYSRCLEPDKYRIVGARVDAWTDALASTGLADVSTADPSSVWNVVPRYSTSRTVHVRPRRAGAVSLVFGVRSALAPDDGVIVGAGDPAVQLELMPDCGCDACDSGSADLLAVIDDTIVNVVTGNLVHVTVPGGTVQTTDIEDGWSANTDLPNPDIERLLDEARDGRSPYPVVTGAAWWA